MNNANVTAALAMLATSPGHSSVMGFHWASTRLTLVMDFHRSVQTSMLWQLKTSGHHAVYQFTATTTTARELIIM